MLLIVLVTSHPFWLHVAAGRATRFSSVSSPQRRAYTELPPAAPFWSRVGGYNYVESHPRWPVQHERPPRMLPCTCGPLWQVAHYYAVNRQYYYVYYVVVDIRPLSVPAAVVGRAELSHFRAKFYTNLDMA